MKTIAVRCQRAKDRISFSSKKEKNYESNTWDKIDSDHLMMMKTYCNSEKKGIGRRYKQQKWLISYMSW